MTHAQISPGKQSRTFSQYKNGLIKEKESYICGVHMKGGGGGGG